MARNALLLSALLCAMPAAAPALAQDSVLTKILRGEEVAAAQREFEPLVIRGQSPDEEPITTDRPDFTEASSVVGAGVFQMESGYTYIYDDSDQDDSLTHTNSAPEMLWRVGITDTVELRIAWNYQWEQSRNAGVTDHIDGASDLYLGAKIALRDQEEWLPESAIIIQGTVPTGAAAFTNTEVSAGFNLLCSWDLNDEWSLAGSTGMNTAFDELLIDSDGYVVGHQSLSLGHSITDKVGSYLEYFGLYTFGRNSNYPANYIDGGFTYLVTNDVQLDCRLGVGLNDQADDLFSGAGLSFRF